MLAVDFCRRWSRLGCPGGFGTMLSAVVPAVAWNQGAEIGEQQTGWQAEQRAWRVGRPLLRLCC
jgi:hypothetical protein